jgi:hypothetical protein
MQQSLPSEEPQPQPVKKEIHILDILQLTPEEKAEVEAAAKASSTFLNQLIKEGLLLKARKINTETKRLEGLSIEQRRQSTFIGAATANLRRTANAIVTWNHEQYNNDLRVYINASILRTLTGSNLNTIKDFLVSYRTNDQFLETAEEHNQRYGLVEGDNRKGRDQFGNRIKIADLIRNSYAPLVEPTQPAPEAVVDAQQPLAPQVKLQSKPKAKKTPQPKVDAQQPAKSQSKPKAEKTPPHLDIQIIALLSPVEFAEAVDELPEADVKTLCEAKMSKLRQHNKGKSVHSLQKLIFPYRKEFEKLALNAHNTYHHQYETPRTITDTWQPVPGSIYSEDKSKVLSEPRHLALKYLSLNEQENDSL